MRFGWHLELDELAHLRVERMRDADEDVDPDIGRSRLDLPEIGAADARHQGELPLRDALLASELPDAGPQLSLFAHVIHASSIRAI